MAKLKSTLISSKRLQSGIKGPAQYLTGMDLFNGHVSIPMILVYPQGMDLGAIERSLVQTMQSYPVITGRIKKDAQGDQYIDNNDAGIDFRVSRCSGVLPSYGAHNPFGKDIDSYVRRSYPWQVVDKDMPLFQIDIYQFDDGGVILCLLGVHSLFDGSSFWQFVLDWSKTHRGLAIDPTSLDRDVVIAAGQVHPHVSRPAELVYDPKMGERISLLARLGFRAVTSTAKGVFRIPASTVQKWHADAKNELPAGAKVSTAELVTAYCLKTLSPVMEPGRYRTVGIVLDLRYKRPLNIPRNYFGNALGYGQARYTPDELATLSIPVLAQKCRPEPEGISTDALCNYLALVEKYRQAKAIWKLFLKPAGDTLQGGLVLNNCIHLPVYEVDFGSGPPSWHDICGVAFRMLMMFPTPEVDGGVDLHFTGRPHELKALGQALKTV
ncbi:MAG: acyltransferase [Pseudomonadota bacterium]